MSGIVKVHLSITIKILSKGLSTNNGKTKFKVSDYMQVETRGLKRRASCFTINLEKQFLQLFQWQYLGHYAFYFILCLVIWVFFFFFLHRSVNHHTIWDLSLRTGILSFEVKMAPKGTTTTSTWVSPLWKRLLLITSALG